MNKKTIVCFGDSMVYGYPVSRSECWVTLLQEQSGYSVINRGMNGDTTEGMLRRFDSQVLKESPGWLFLLGGTNDFLLGNSLSSVQNNLMFLMRRAQAEQIRVRLATVTPYLPELAAYGMFAGMDLGRAESLRQKLNTWIRSQEECLDTASAIESLPQETWPDYSVDGIHINAAGHRLIAGFLLQHFHQ